MLGLVATPNTSAATSDVTKESQAATREADGVKLQALADSDKTKVGVLPCAFYVHADSPIQSLSLSLELTRFGGRSTR